MHGPLPLCSQQCHQDWHIDHTLVLKFIDLRKVRLSARTSESASLPAHEKLLSPLTFDSPLTYVKRGNDAFTKLFGIVKLGKLRPSERQSAND